MTNQTIEIEILRYLRLMEAAQQLKALDYVKSLVKSKESPNAALLKFAGYLDKQSIGEIEQAIKSDCENIWENE